MKSMVEPHGAAIPAVPQVASCGGTVCQLPSAEAMTAAANRRGKSTPLPWQRMPNKLPLMLSFLEKLHDRRSQTKQSDVTNFATSPTRTQQLAYRRRAHRMVLPVRGMASASTRSRACQRFCCSITLAAPIWYRRGEPCNEGEVMSRLREFLALPLDYTRCAPMPMAADKCNTCARYSLLQQQTWGPRTPLMQQKGFPHFDGCARVPVEFLEHTE